MAPHPTPAPTPYWTQPLVKRQASSSLPSCVSPCLYSADIGTCDSLTDLACLCNSSVLYESVASCLDIYCTTISDLQAGYDYADAVCLAESVTIPATTITSANTLSTGISTAAVSVSTTASVSASSESAATTTATAVAPVTTTLHDPTKVVDIVMSIICALLLLVAIGIAVWNFRSRIAKDKAETQARSWTGAGSTTGGNTFNSAKGFNNFSRADRSQNKPRNLSHLDSSMFTRSAGATSNNNLVSLNRGNGMEDYDDDDLDFDSKYDLKSDGRDPFGEEKRSNPPRLSLNRAPIFKVSDELDGQEAMVATIPELDEIESAEPSPAADSQFSAGASTTNLGEVREEASLSRGKRMSGVMPELWGKGF